MMREICNITDDSYSGGLERRDIEEQVDGQTKEEERGTDHPLPISKEERRLVTTSVDFIVRSLEEQIADGSLILQDPHERRHVWDNIKSSRLIESLLLNVPIPTFYLAEIGDGEYAVIDGQQRLTAIHNFINNGYRLSGLKVKNELNGLKFKKMSPQDQRLIKSRPLRCIIIMRESSPIVRFDVFERLNTASVQLSPQELRNCLYRGPLNEMLVQLANNQDFMYVRRVNRVDQRMKDEETILRFFALHSNLPHYLGNLKEFLDTFQADNASLKEVTLNQYKALFERVISDVRYVFEDNAFRKYNHEIGSWETPVNRPLYEAVVLCYANANSEYIRSNRDALLNLHKSLCSNEKFLDAISVATVHRLRVKTRISMYREAMIQAGIPVKEFDWWSESSEESE